MGLPKGRTNNTKGREVGSKNVRTQQWEALGASIQEVHTKRFNEVLAGMDDEAFARTYLQVLEYFKPKLARTEIQAAVETKEVQTFTIGGKEITF